MLLLCIYTRKLRGGVVAMSICKSPNSDNLVTRIFGGKAIHLWFNLHPSWKHFSASDSEWIGQILHYGLFDARVVLL